ncbi:glycosyltransferase family 4 protein [Pseudomonas saponiphila]|uniref:glycosyltransferase family 4 protein n=1 Tax=Pseudomonas saponiphila TaxID=556534 RepID=UPI001FC941BD|nr:glycosyltransferase family 4 protein [Pseudomonas saponiphila]
MAFYKLALVFFKASPRGQQVSKKSLKVARVSTVSFFIITQLKTQLNDLSRSGVEVTAISSFDEMSEVLVSDKEIKFTPVNIERKVDLLKDLYALFCLVKIFFKEKFDVVHSTTPKAGLLCAIAGFFTRNPVRLHTYTGQPWVTMTGLKRAILKACDKIIGALNTHCYADSHSQMEFLISNRVIKRSRISVLGEGSIAGIDLERFNPERYSTQAKNELKGELCLGETCKIVLFVGRIAQDKGVAELLAAFAGILSKDKDVALVLVGPFEPEGESIIDSASEEVKRHIRIVGYCNEPEKYMAIADFLCLPSYREGFGTVIIEAAAMGIPAVGTDIYGLSDAIQDGVTGVLVKVADPISLERGIYSLLNWPELRLSMGIAARSRAVNKFDSSLCSELLMKEYKEFLGDDF